MATSINSADFDAICADCGETISYSTESTTVNSRGDVTGSLTDRGNITAIIQSITDGESIIDAGIVNVGDYRVFFKASTLSAANPPALHDVLVINSTNYRIVKLTSEEIGGNTIFYECLASKIAPEAA